MTTYFKDISLRKTGNNYTANAWVQNDDIPGTILYCTILSNSVIIDKYYSEDTDNQNEALISICDNLLWDNGFHDWLDYPYEINQSNYSEIQFTPSNEI